MLFLSPSILRPFFRKKYKKKTLFFQFLFFINIPHFLEIIKTHHTDKKNCVCTYIKNNNVKKKTNEELFFCLCAYDGISCVDCDVTEFVLKINFLFRLMIPNLNHCFILSLCFYTFFLPIFINLFLKYFLRLGPYINDVTWKTRFFYPSSLCRKIFIQKKSFI